jgi:para-aminobenzoate synthetase component I
MDKNKAIKAMNKLGKDQIPFLFIIDFDMHAPLVYPITEIDAHELLFDVNGFSNSSVETSAKHALVFERTPITPADYSLKFDKVMQEITRGNTYLLNLTCPTAIETNLDLPEIFARSSARYKLWMRDLCVVFSPESFITIADGKISSFPMKGTIDAALENAEQIILDDPKEIAEHYTIVDLIRNDLSMVAKEVVVEQFRYVEKLKTSHGALLQISSRITGRLPADYRERTGDIVFTLLPAGSVTGAPKKKTVEIIRGTEGYERGYYSGIFGYFDGNRLDSGVMIRFIEKTNQGLIYKSGGGITSFSRKECEYQEMIDKVYVPFN